jgi:hypothetical protein
MDNAELDGVVPESGDVHSNDNHTEMKSEERTFGLDNIVTRVQLIDGWCGAISGDENRDEVTGKSANELVGIMREQLFDELRKEESDFGMSHLEILAEKQRVKLEDYPEVDVSSSVEDKLRFVKVLAENINKVQNRNSLGITPKISRELNCMDCSMSTWVMIHEANKKGIDIEFGAPLGHAIGIASLGKDKYYADGQKGFVEKIDTEEILLPNGSKLLKIVNHEEIQDRQREGEFFPEFVFVDKDGGVSATMTNIDSMLFKNSEYGKHTKEEIERHFTELADNELAKLEEKKQQELLLEGVQVNVVEEKHKGMVENVRRRYEQDARTYTSLLPYIKEFSDRTSEIQREEMEKVKQELSPDLEEFRSSDEYKKDEERLRRPS